jgi:hypothetical protein
MAQDEKPGCTRRPPRARHRSGEALIRVELNPKTILIATADDRKNLRKIFAVATGGYFRSLAMFDAFGRAWSHVLYNGRSEPTALRIFALYKLSSRTLPPLPICRDSLPISELWRRSWSPWRGPVIATAKKNVERTAH